MFLAYSIVLISSDRLSYVNISILCLSFQILDDLVNKETIQYNTIGHI